MTQQQKSRAQGAKNQMKSLQQEQTQTHTHSCCCCLLLCLAGITSCDMVFLFLMDKTSVTWLQRPDRQTQTHRQTQTDTDTQFPERKGYSCCCKNRFRGGWDVLSCGFDNSTMNCWHQKSCKLGSFQYCSVGNN